MDQNVLTLIIILGVAAIFAGIVILAVKRAGKGASDEAILEKILTGLGYAQSVAVAIKPFLPGIAGTVITKVLTYAQQAVTRVEATYKAALTTSTAAGDTRQAEATSLIKSALALEGIEDTEQIDKLINTVIPLLVLALPKTHDAATDSKSTESGTAAPDTTDVAKTSM